MTTTTVTQEQGQFLSFTVAGEEYAVGILRVKEIIEYGDVTRVPSTPAFVRGVINLRGSVVPVIDLAVKFGFAETPVTRWTCIIIVEADVEGQSSDIGLVADSVSQVMDLSAGQIERPPAFGTRVNIDYLVGMGKVDRKFVLILDIDRVIAAEEVLAALTSGDDALLETGRAGSDESEGRATAGSAE